MHVLKRIAIVVALLLGAFGADASYIANGIRKITVAGATSATTAALPAGATILQIYAFNNSGNAVTGGLKFGSTNGAADIVVALAGLASVYSVPATLLLTKFSGAQTIYIDAVASWNSANVDIVIQYMVF